MFTKMKMLIAKVIVLIVIFCFHSFIVWGQNKLDELIISNSRIEREIKKLETDIKLYQDSIGRIEQNFVKDSIILNDLQVKRNLLVFQNSTDFLEKLEKEVDSLRTYNDEIIAKINETKSELEKKRKIVARNQSEMAGMGAFSAVQKEKIFTENMQYLKRRFSQMDIEKLQELRSNSQEFSSMNEYQEYLKRIDYTITNKKIYDDGIIAINAPFDEPLIVSIRDRIVSPSLVKKDDLKSGIFKLTEDQFFELDSLDIKLSRYKGGLKVLKGTINDINTDESILSLRASKRNSSKKEILNRIREYVLPKQDTDRRKAHERYFRMVPYLENLLKQYWTEISQSPFISPTKTEKIISNIVISNNTPVISNDYTSQLEHALEKKEELEQKEARLKNILSGLKNNIKDKNKKSKIIKEEIANKQKDIDKLSETLKLTSYSDLLIRKEQLETSVNTNLGSLANLNEQLLVTNKQLGESQSQREELDKVKREVSSTLISENRPYIDQPFSKISIEKLKEIHKKCSPYTTDQKVNAFVVNIEIAIKNKETYDEICKVLNSPYQKFAIIQSLEKLQSMQSLNISQRNEIVSIKKQLESFSDGLLAFKEFINNLNECRRGTDKYSWDYFLADKRPIYKNNLEERINTKLYAVPYLKNKYEEFMKAFKKSPNKHFDIETEILNQ